MDTDKAEPGFWNVLAGIIVASFATCPTFLAMAAVLDVLSLLNDKFLTGVLDFPSIMMFGWAFSLPYSSPCALVNGVFLAVIAHHRICTPWLAASSGLLSAIVVVLVAPPLPATVLLLLLLTGVAMGLLQWFMIAQPRRRWRRQVQIEWQAAHPKD